MGIKSNLNDFLSELREVPDKIENQVLSVLVQVGEEAVRVARGSKTYKDDTGNLTASIGYGVFKGRSLVAQGGFDYSKDGGSVGAAKLLEHLREMPQKGVGLIIVAGMDYAAYVERSGYVVLDGARFKTGELVNNLLSQLKL